MLTCDPTLLPISTGPQWVTPSLPCCMTGFSCWRVRSPGKVFSTRFSTSLSSLLPLPHLHHWVLGAWCGMAGRRAGKEAPSLAFCSTSWHRTSAAGRLALKCMESCTFFVTTLEKEMDPSHNSIFILFIMFDFFFWAMPLSLQERPFGLLL